MALSLGPHAALRAPRWGWALLLAAGALAAASAAPPPAILWLVEGDRAIVEARGLDPAVTSALERLAPGDAGWTERFAVYTEEASQAGDALPPLMGSYSVAGSAVRFVPRFPLAPGVTYVARWRDPAPKGAEIRSSFSIPRSEPASSTRLLAIYPSGSQVPENLLRVYLQFSAPMSLGHAHRHIRLLDAAGEPVEGPFVAPERELWSPDGTRLTLFFDPGRIKRGVGPNAEVGPPLRPGGRYRLEVDRRLADARGAPLDRDYSKVLEVGGSDREQPRVEDWVLEPPEAPGDPVRLSFPEPLDRGLLESLIDVLDARGEPVPGKASVGDGETRWSFRPEGSWGDGVYRIRVTTLLEDLAGNSLRRPFEVALNDDGEPDESAAYLDLPFARAGARRAP